MQDYELKEAQDIQEPPSESEVIASFIEHFQRDVETTDSMNHPRVREVLEKNLTLDSLRIMKDLMGLSSELGHLSSILRHHLFEGKALYPSLLANRLGNLCYFLFDFMSIFGFDFESIIRDNINKRNQRYPNGFDVTGSVFDANRSQIINGQT